jgi:hypothetical protein
LVVIVVLLVIGGISALVHAVESGSSKGSSKGASAQAPGCVIYYRNQDAELRFYGPAASSQCHRFATHRPEEEGEEREWTRAAPQLPPQAERRTICSMTNSRGERVVALDTGGAYYAHDACRVLSHQNWNRVKSE